MDVRAWLIGANRCQAWPPSRVAALTLRISFTKQPVPGGVPPRAELAVSEPAGAAQLLQDLKRQVAVLQEHLVAAEARATAAECNTAAVVDLATADEIIEGNSVLQAEEPPVVTPSDPLETAKACLEDVRVNEARLQEIIASVDSSLCEALADNQRLSAAVADAQGELAFEADRRAAFEREVTALKSRLQQQEKQQQEKQQPAVAGVQVDSPAEQECAENAEASLVRLQTICSRQAEDIVTALRRAGTAEQELADARTSIADLTASARNLQGTLDAAETKAQENARGTADAQARVEAAERATEAEATRVRTGLQRRLQDAESRAASLGEELEAALAARQERDSQAAQASQAAAADTLTVCVFGTCDLSIGQRHALVCILVVESV